jgi:hypothetical protein
LGEQVRPGLEVVPEGQGLVPVMVQPPVVGLQQAVTLAQGTVVQVEPMPPKTPAQAPGELRAQAPVAVVQQEPWQADVEQVALPTKVLGAVQRDCARSVQELSEAQQEPKVSLVIVSVKGPPAVVFHMATRMM